MSSTSSILVNAAGAAVAVAAGAALVAGSAYLWGRFSRSKDEMKSTTSELKIDEEGAFDRLLTADIPNSASDSVSKILPLSFVDESTSSKSATDIIPFCVKISNSQKDADDGMITPSSNNESTTTRFAHIREGGMTSQDDIDEPIVSKMKQLRKPEKKRSMMISAATIMSSGAIYAISFTSWAANCYFPQLSKENYYLIGASAFVYGVAIASLAEYNLKKPANNNRPLCDNRIYEIPCSKCVLIDNNEVDDGSPKKNIEPTIDHSTAIEPFVESQQAVYSQEMTIRMAIVGGAVIAAGATLCYHYYSTKSHKQCADIETKSTVSSSSNYSNEKRALFTPITIHFGDKNNDKLDITNAFVDSGSDSNIILSSIVGNMKLQNSNNQILNLVGTGNLIVGEIELDLEWSGVITRASFLVVTHSNYPVLLGCPWIAQTGTVISRQNDRFLIKRPRTVPIMPLIQKLSQPTLKVNINGNFEPTEAMIDTGATISGIELSLATSKNCVIQLESKNVIQIFGGYTYTPYGESDVSVNFDGLNTKIQLSVMDKTITPLLLGTDWIAELGDSGLFIFYDRNIGRMVAQRNEPSYK